MKPATFKLLRGMHRWAGLFFAPLIVLFALSGLTQTLDAESWMMPEWAMSALYAIQDAHQDQRFARGTTLRPVATALIVAMAVALIVTTALGVVMAYVMYPKRRLWITLALLAGVVIPALLLAL